jgi:hypothetical protein
MTQAHGKAQNDPCQTSNVTTVPRSTTVREAHINPKVLFWTVVVAAVVVVMSFASIILHGLYMRGL